MTAPPTTDIAAWLTARLDEDEAAARAAMGAGSGEWASWNRSWDTEPQRDLAVDGARKAVLPMWMDEHVCRHDPARVLAQVAAHRRIVEEHVPHRYLDVCWVCFDRNDDAVTVEPEPWPCPTLRALASIYADADGFDPRWAE